MNDCLLCSPLEPNLREGRIFVSTVFTLVLAQGLAHSRCSVSVAERKGGREEGADVEPEGGYRQDKRNSACDFTFIPRFTQSPSDLVSVIPHLEGRAWVSCLWKTLDSCPLWLP